MRAAIYARVSKADRDDPRSIPVQLADCGDIVESNGWAVVDTYIDHGISGWNPKATRDAYERLLERIAAGAVDVVIAQDVDRLFRSDRERFRFGDIAEAASMRLIEYANGDRHRLDTANGSRDFRDAASAAQHYSDRLSEKLRRKHRAIAAMGGNSGGERPYGFEKDRVTIRPAEAANIQAAARRVITGESLRSIAADWNRRYITTARGKDWRPTQLRKMLLAARTAGLREHLGTLVGKAVWDAIIDEPTHDLLQALLNDPHRRTSHSTVRKYVLTGLVYCAECGGKLYSHGRGDGGGRAYRCESGPNRDGCGKVSVAAAPLEQYVSDAAYNVWQYTVDDAENVPAPFDNRDRFVGQIATLEERLASLGRMYAAGDIGDAEFVAASKDLRSAIESNRAELGKIAARPKRRTYLKTLGLNPIVRPWESDNPDADTLESFRAIITDVVERVTVASAGKRGGRFDPTRASIHWLDLERVE